MGNINHDYIEKYLRSLIIEDDKLLLELESYGEEYNIPIIHPEVKQLLRVIIKSNDIKSMLEVGTAIGYSAIVFSKAMEKGKVTTIENNSDMVAIAKKNIFKAQLQEEINIKFGDANKIIYDLEDTYDCIFLDGAKGHYIHLLDQCLHILKPKGLLISDNVLFRGMIATDELVKRRKITIVKRMRNYLDTISNHPDLMTSVIPIGDGLAISYKL